MKEQATLPSERGQQLVEFALILPVLLLLLLGIMEFGIVIFSYDTIANVGREVARYGAVHPYEIDEPDEFDTFRKEEIDRWTTGIITERLHITPTLNAGEWLTSTIRVTVTYEYRFLTGPMIRAVGGDPNLTLRTVTTMRTEIPYTE
ncbi:MAG: TadE/TadG family type IV pilus assembly protein [Anaerolineae bacterium]